MIPDNGFNTFMVVMTQQFESIILSSPVHKETIFYYSQKKTVQVFLLPSWLVTPRIGPRGFQGPLSGGLLGGTELESKKWAMEKFALSARENIPQVSAGEHSGLTGFHFTNFYLGKKFVTKIGGEKTVLVAPRNMSEKYRQKFCGTWRALTH